MSKLSFIPSLIVYDFDGVMTDNRAFVDEMATKVYLYIEVMVTVSE